MSEELKVTPGKQWGAPFQEGVVIKLPSGKNVKVRPVSVDVLLTTGEIPDFLSVAAAKILWDEIPLEKLNSDLKLAEEMARLANIIIPACLISPRIRPYLKGQTITHPDELPLEPDEIRIDWIHFLDKAALFQLAIQPAEVLYSFRNQQIGSLDALPVLEELPSPTEQPIQ